LQGVAVALDDGGVDAKNGRVQLPGFVAVMPGSGVIMMPPVSVLPPGVDDRAGGRRRWTSW